MKWISSRRESGGRFSHEVAVEKIEPRDEEERAVCGRPDARLPGSIVLDTISYGRKINKGENLEFSLRYVLRETRLRMMLRVKTMRIQTTRVKRPRYGGQEVTMTTARLETKGNYQNVKPVKKA
ncbi:hypothetical protein PIB30_029544 [Stylosanthes scabra]|uniref:Uncharacterized protein n=1 Tax=Stylosanthes scabra TaxID=79078 RepID=A0ABU6VBE6_9FABA|nr:hypothetical protein [Stylosanthes scabra]